MSLSVNPYSNRDYKTSKAKLSNNNKTSDMAFKMELTTEQAVRIGDKLKRTVYAEFKEDAHPLLLIFGKHEVLLRMGKYNKTQVKAIDIDNGVARFREPEEFLGYKFYTLPSTQEADEFYRNFLSKSDK